MNQGSWPHLWLRELCRWQSEIMLECRRNRLEKDGIEGSVSHLSGAREAIFGAQV